MMFRMPQPTKSDRAQTLLIDADDTLWENNIYFERAITSFISFLNHHEYSPQQVREVLDDVERECIVSHGYGLHSFAHALAQTFERLAVEPLTPALHETVSGFAHAIAEHPIEILPTSGQITIVTEAFSEVRRIYMNVPQLPMGDVPPGYYGRSVGTWEGATLVVDTIGVKTSVPAYQNMPHSDQMRITERIRLVTKDILHDQITIDDPAVLEKPVTYTLAYRRMPGYEMVEFVCDNNREYIDDKGGTHLKVRER
jgi:hypothetical protein